MVALVTLGRLVVASLLVEVGIVVVVTLHGDAGDTGGRVTGLLVKQVSYQTVHRLD